MKNSLVACHSQHSKNRTHSHHKWHSFQKRNKWIKYVNDIPNRRWKFLQYNCISGVGTERSNSNNNKFRRNNYLHWIFCRLFCALLSHSLSHSTHWWMYSSLSHFSLILFGVIFVVFCVYVYVLAYFSISSFVQQNTEIEWVVRHYNWNGFAFASENFINFHSKWH